MIFEKKWNINTSSRQINRVMSIISMLLGCVAREVNVPVMMIVRSRAGIVTEFT